ncbi:MAG: hypothetical protein AB2A00_20460 [Myxococcota bacterium]
MKLPAPRFPPGLRPPAVLVAVLAVACASSRAVPSAGPPAPGYGYAEASPPLAPLESSALDGLGRILGARGAPAPVLDARVSRAASALNVYRAGNPATAACDVPTSIQETTLEWAGVYERPLCQRCLWTTRAQPNIPVEVLQGLADCMAGAEPSLFGLSAQRIGSRTFVSLLGTQRRVLLNPMPRAAPMGQPIVVGGSARLGTPLSVLVDVGSGPTQAFPVQPAADGTFQVTVPPVEKPALVVLSVVQDGQEVVRARLEAGIPARSFPLSADEEGPLDANEQLRALQKALVEIRTERGLEALPTVPQMDAVAQAMANQSQQSAHWLQDPPPPDELSAANPSAAAHWGLKLQGTSAKDLAAQLRASPLMLWRLTRPGALQLGVGLAVPRAARNERRVAAVVLLAAPVADAFTLPAP